MTIEFSTITGGLWNFAGWLAYILPPIVMVGVSIRAAMYILNLMATAIISAFGPEPPPSLTRTQFEAKYGAFRPEDLKAAYNLRARERPFNITTLTLLGLSILLFIVLAASALTSGSTALWLTSLLAWLGGFTVLMVGLGFIRERHFGSETKALWSHILSTYKVAPEDRVTWKTLRPLVPKKS